MTPAEYLRAIHDVLLEEGWTQGTYHRGHADGSVSHCMVGAWAEVGRRTRLLPRRAFSLLVELPLQNETCQRAYTALAHFSPDANVTRQNDYECESIDDALDWVRRAEKYAEETWG